MKNIGTEDQTLDYELMIVGGGPAGISTWLHLKKYAPELADHTLLIEKEVFPRDKLCAGGVGGWSADVLEHLEVELDIPSLFISDVEFRFGDETFHLHHPNFFRIVQRIDFDYALVKIAVNRGLTIHEGETLIDVTRENNRLRVTTSKKSYCVKILIGADGVFSIVGRKMMPRRLPRLAPTIEMFAGVHAAHESEFSEKKMVVDLGPVKEGLQGYVWHIPCLRNHTPSIIHGICDFRLHRDRPRADMAKILTRELQIRHIHPEPKSWHSYPIRYFSNDDSISQPNVLLVGDAAGIEPAFGGGIHIALSYGEVAARAVMDAIQRHDYSFSDYKKRLRSHLVGQWINDCTRMALAMYGGKMNPLDAARELFPAWEAPPDLVSEMISEVANKLQPL